MNMGGLAISPALPSCQLAAIVHLPFFTRFAPAPACHRVGPVPVKETRGELFISRRSLTSYTASNCHSRPVPGSQEAFPPSSYPEQCLLSTARKIQLLAHCRRGSSRCPVKHLLHFACDVHSEDTILISSIASSAEIYRDISSNLSEASLGVRLEEAIKLAEKCATIRENLKLDEEFEELDIQATKLWNLSTTIARESDDVQASVRQKVLNGTPCSP